MQLLILCQINVHNTFHFSKYEAYKALCSQFRRKFSCDRQWCHIFPKYDLNSEFTTKFKNGPAFYCAAYVKGSKLVFCGGFQKGKSQRDFLEKAGPQPVFKMWAIAELEEARMCSVNPLKLLLFIIEGADQSAFGLPPFTTDTKEVRGPSWKVTLIGVLEHGITTESLFKLTGEQEKVETQIILRAHLFYLQGQKRVAF